MERDGVLEHVREITPYFQERVRRLERFDVVAEARGVGLVGAIEGAVAPADASEEDRLRIDYEFGSRIDKACEARGLIVRPSINMCVFSPPLVITREQVDDMFDILEAAISEVESSLTSKDL